MSNNRAPVYPGSNCVWNFGPLMWIFEDAGKLSGTAFRKVEYIVGQTSPAMAQAREVEMAGIALNESADSILSRSLVRAIHHKSIDGLLSMVALEPDQLFEIVRDLDEKQKQGALHDLWHMIHHLERGSSQLVYGNTLARLQQTLRL